ncbi:GerW family sporulation protein [Syntrophomonas palmitatica]|uniref:GerW family sporulation protein n=1 Tax=Syntrophomonas palmitatica TaxID=402877 RepID=UPI0006CF2891|nr:GerW family sporulation protein [Syntrophomonas palmitatica]
MDSQQEKQSHPIEGLMKTAMQAIKEMVDVNTVVGDAVETNDGTVIIPVSQVACGFAAGGGEYEMFNNQRAQELPFAGGSGAGVSVKPVGFLVVRMNDVRLISVTGNQLAERIVDTVPQVMDKVDHIIDKRRKRNGEGKDDIEF